jgi:hypothetical protein
MKFKIQAMPDEGFMVQMLGPDGNVLNTVEGFATHEQAQGFVRDIFVQMMMAFQKGH